MQDIEHVHAAHERSIDEVFALTVAIHAAPDGNLREINRQRAIGVVEHKLNFRNAYWLARR